MLGKESVKKSSIEETNIFQQDVELRNLEKIMVLKQKNKTRNKRPPIRKTIGFWFQLILLRKK